MYVRGGMPKCALGTTRGQGIIRVVVVVVLIVVVARFF